MNRKMMVETQWDMFRCGIVDSVVRIDKHLRDGTNEALYGTLLPWDRPGLLLTLTNNSLAMDIQRYPYSSNFANDLWVTMNANGFLRVKMYFPHGDDGVRTVEMKPEKAWSEQYPEVQKHGLTCCILRGIFWTTLCKQYCRENH